VCAWSQVRLAGRSLELGYIDSAAYMACLSGSRPWPPTVFPGGEADGAERQTALGMTDKAALLDEMRKGTR